jgi:hypothetical protein
MYRVGADEFRYVIMGASLTYSIFEGLLVGFAGNKKFMMNALSGGGGGSTKHAPTFAVNNPYAEGLKTSGAANSKKHVHGGPLPPGQYTIAAPNRLHLHGALSAELLPVNVDSMGRSGFFIHGSGPHGSDGCIVPVNATDFHELMTALSIEGGGTLFVVEDSGGFRFA